MRRIAIFVMMWIAGFANLTFSADLTDDKLVVKAIRLNESVIVDGVLSESIWKNGHGVTKFTQRDPIEGAKPTEQTEVRVAYDDNAIYIGARMHDSAPDSIIAQLARRDAIISSDYFMFFIDPYYDRRSGFYFGLTAAGTLLDGVLMNDEWDDDSWDGVWEGKVNIDNDGWTTELRIPYSQLRFHKKDKYVWSVNFKRAIQRNNEQDYLVFTPKDGSGFVSRFVDLVGIENIEPARQIEFLPYFRTKAEYTNPDPGNPFHDGSKYLPATGADIKFGIGNNLTLDATVNPDFGQVEVDPAVVNLSDIETFYDEKRPFFIEGSSIFNFGQGGANSFYGLNWSGPDFFYTRRIGRAPQGSLPEYDFINLPEGARILGAAKLSGKVGNNWNIGTLHAVTNREKAELNSGGQRSHVEVEPLTYYGIFRGQKEFQEGKQGLGMISTLTARKFDDDRLRDQLNTQSMSLGIDGWTFFDKNRTWVITGWAGMTHVRGSQERITALQQSSRHYFQKPGVSHVEVDTTATSMTGFAGRFWINKQKGNFIFNTALGIIDPKFDVNDVGFMWRTDVINGHIISGYKWVKPGKFTRHAELYFATFGSWDFGGNQIWSGIFHSGELKFLNYWEIDWFWAYNPESISNRLTRGGPLALNPSGYEGDFGLESDDRKPWVVGLYFYGGNYESTKYWSFSPSIEWKPTDNLSLTVSPDYMRDRTIAHWVDAFDDPTATATYGRRYIFAELNQTTLAASIRLNWTFTPQLSLQLYAQPLISSGDYYDFKELARPRSYDFNIYNQEQSTFDGKNYIIDPDGFGPADSLKFENPDFNFKSLRGNAVLRWEYMPGSTLYLVWTQSRSDREQIGEFQFNRSFRRLWDADVDNIFMIKVAYWFSI
jgi:hypothetical protein